jgi:chemotaxis protein methyltransferase CheR
MADIRPITDEEFSRFKHLIYEVAGISLSPEKKVLVSGRLNKRLLHHRLHTFGEYYRLVTSKTQPGEFQLMVDLLTTNETYFFREPQHFDFLKEEILRGWRGDNFRIWSAASSSGEEIYTLAMVLSEAIGTRPWEVLGSDISQRMLQLANMAVYPMTRASNMPHYYLSKYCLKGVRSQEGMLLIDKRLKSRVKFLQINLMEPLPHIGMFEVIFVRNVMIYFDQKTKESLVKRLLGVLKPGGYIITSHSESMHSISREVEMVRPSIYRKPGGTLR